MTEQITQEQAVKVAEWLGEIPEPKEFRGRLGVHCPTPEGMRQYLYSPEGQSAVMDKLDGTLVYTVNQYPIEEKFDYCACKIVLQDTKKQHIIGRGPTRQHALLLAVLEMIGG